MIIYMPIVMAIIGLLFMVSKKSWVLKQDAGDGKMKEISDHIYEGALAFLKAEYRLLTMFVIGVSVLLFIVSTVVPSTHWLIVIAFIVGAFFSALAGNMGMKIATKTNVRTTQAARTSLPNALKVSFGGGTVMGLGVAGLAVLGLTMFFITALPVSIGLYINTKYHNITVPFLPIANKISTVLFIIIVIGALASEWDLFIKNLNKLAPAIITLIIIMLFIGYNTALWFGISKKKAITISIESGIQNATVGITIGGLILNQGTGLSILSLPSGVYGILMYLVCLPFVFWFLKR